VVRDGACAPPHHEDRTVRRVSRPHPEEARSGVSGRCVASPREGWATQRTMTRHLILAARCVRVIQSNHPHERTEGAGKTGCRSHPWSACNKKARGRTTGTSRTTGLPCAMVLRLIRDLPGDQALLPPSPRIIREDLAPALGRQDHTISPSAPCCSSHNTPRPSHPAPNVRDDREAPLLRVRDAREHGFDLPDGATEKFASPWHDRQFAHGVHAVLSAVMRATAKQSSLSPQRQTRLLRRVALRNDGVVMPACPRRARRSQATHGRCRPSARTPGQACAR
jgi:hypothetical protein